MNYPDLHVGDELVTPVVTRFAATRDHIGPTISIVYALRDDTVLARFEQQEVPGLPLLVETWVSGFRVGWAALLRKQRDHTIIHGETA